VGCERGGGESEEVEKTQMNVHENHCWQGTRGHADSHGITINIVLVRCDPTTVPFTRQTLISSTWSRLPISAQAGDEQEAKLKRGREQSRIERWPFAPYACSAPSICVCEIVRLRMVRLVAVGKFRTVSVGDKGGHFPLDMSDILQELRCPGDRRFGGLTR
jgi:hypothetical protein